MAAKKFRGWLRLKGFVAAASGYWRRLVGLALFIVVELPAVRSSKWPARKQRNHAAQIEFYSLLGQRGPLDSPNEGSDGQRLRKRQRRVLNWEVSRGGADQTVSNEEADPELRPEANWKLIPYSFRMTVYNIFLHFQPLRLLN